MTRIHITFDNPELTGFAGESLHAERTGDGPTPGSGLYKLDNIPFFASNLRLHDVVVCTETSDAMPEFESVHERSPQPSAWIVFAEGTSDEDMSTVANTLRALGTKTERGMATLWAIALPEDEDKRELALDVLDAGSRTGVLQYEMEEE